MTDSQHWHPLRSAGQGLRTGQQEAVWKAVNGPAGSEPSGPSARERQRRATAKPVGPAPATSFASPCTGLVLRGQVAFGFVIRASMPMDHFHRLHVTTQQARRNE